MRSLLLLLALCLATSCDYQEYVYDADSSGVGIKIVNETQELKLDEAIIPPPRECVQNDGPFLDSSIWPQIPPMLVPELLNLGFKIASNQIEAKLIEYTGEYVLRNSYLDAGNKSLPAITYERMVDLGKGAGLVPALKLYLMPKCIEGMEAFIYYVDSLDLSYSKAKTSPKNKAFDYIIDIQPTFVAGGKKISQEIHPITLNNVGFDSVPPMTDFKYRTDFILIPKGGVLSDVSVRIIEVNPSKIEYEKILEILELYSKDIYALFKKYVEEELKKKEEGKKSRK